MGQAKRRGTFEQRLQQAQIAQLIVEKDFESMAARRRILRQYDGNVRRLASVVIEKQKQDALTTQAESKIPMAT